MNNKPNINNPIGRRAFLFDSAVFASSIGFPMIVSASTLGRGGILPPSERIRLGQIGCGKMGIGLRNSFAGSPDVELVAFCDVEPKRLADYKNYSEAILAKRLGKSQTDSVKVYEDYNDLLARSDIDGVIISTPDHWHANITIAACRAGKDIYCEKPLTHTVQESYDVCSAVKRYGRILQTGSQQRSDSAFRTAVELVRNGRLGKVHTIRCRVGGSPKFDFNLVEHHQDFFNWDRWVGPSLYRPYNTILAPMNPAESGFPSWRYYSDFGGGGQCDFGAHMYDIAQWAIGRDGDGPVEVIPPEPGNPDRQYLTYIYSDGVKLQRSPYLHYPEKTENAVEFTGESGVLYVSRGNVLLTKPSHLKLEPISANDIRVYHSSNHRDNFLECIKTRKKTICNEDVGSSTAITCNLGIIAERLGRSFLWDHRAGRSNDAEVNRYLNPPKRAQYAI